jgi:hypothetical protein
MLAKKFLVEKFFCAGRGGRGGRRGLKRFVWAVSGGSFVGCGWLMACCVRLRASGAILVNPVANKSTAPL